MATAYVNSITGITADQLEGFFQGWPNRPSDEMFLSILRGSSHIWLAMESGRCIGFINAISDGFFTAYCPLSRICTNLYRG